MEQTDCIICRSKSARTEARGRDFIYGCGEDVFSAVRCLDCGHIYLNPRPAPEAIGVIYPPAYATFSGKFSGSAIQRVKNGVTFGRLRKIVGRLSPHMRIIDIGCGDGELLLTIREHLRHGELFGLDWKFPQNVRDRLEGHGIHLVEARMEEAELPAAHFDLVVMNQLIEHLWDPRAALASIRHALKPTGLLLLSTPNIDGYDRHLFGEGLWGGYYFPRHLNLFSEQSLRRLLQESGFEPLIHRDLVAPLVWLYSLRAWIQTRTPSLRGVEKLLEPSNLPLLFLLATLDFIASRFGETTSNQNVLARLSASHHTV